LDVGLLAVVDGAKNAEGVTETHEHERDKESTYEDEPNRWIMRSAYADLRPDIGHLGGCVRGAEDGDY
jgi:hypothetical protein